MAAHEFVLWKRMEKERETEQVSSDWHCRYNDWSLKKKKKKKKKIETNFYTHSVRPKTVSHELVIIASQVAHRPHFRDSEPQK